MSRELSCNPQLSQFQQHWLTLLSGLSGCTRAACYLVDQQGIPYAFYHQQVPAAMFRDYLDNFQQLDPLHPKRYAEQPPALLNTRQLVSTLERSHHPYYQEFLRPWEIQDTLELFFKTEQRVTAGVSLFIDSHQQPLTHWQLQRLAEAQQLIQFSLCQLLTTPSQQSFQSYCERFQLTRRERQVLSQVQRQLSNQQIAEQLGCSLSTVKTHLQQLFSKTGARSKMALVGQLHQTDI